MHMKVKSETNRAGTHKQRTYAHLHMHAETGICSMHMNTYTHTHECIDALEQDWPDTVKYAGDILMSHIHELAG